MEAAADTVPVITLTGFLGSGKSTLLNAVLGSNAMPPVAVIVNELGEIPIDHALIENVSEGIAVLPSGCVCCAVRSDLEYTLRELYLKRVRRVIPDFRAVLLETTGLADPGPVLQTLFSQPVRELRYTAGIVLTTVDCTHAAATLSVYPEAMRQIAMADRLVLTKSDLSNPHELQATEDWIDTLNPAAPRIVTTKGNAALDELFGRGFPDALHTESAEMDRWFTAASLTPPTPTRSGRTPTRSPRPSNGSASTRPSKTCWPATASTSCAQKAYCRLLESISRWCSRQSITRSTHPIFCPVGQGSHAKADS